MKKEFKGFIIGVIITAMLMSTAVFADEVKHNIEVMFNSVHLTVNGVMVEADNILFNETTYVPLREIAEILGKEVGWDEETNTASINDKKQTDKEVSENDEEQTPDVQEAGENEYIVKDDAGNALYSFKINKITNMSDRNRFSDKEPAQVILIDYTYKNIANPKDLFLSDTHFSIIDSASKVGYTYPNNITNYPTNIPAGVICDAQMIFGIDNESDKVTVNFYENIFGDLTTSFEIPIE